MSMIDDVYQEAFDGTTALESLREAVTFPTVPGGTYRLEIQSTEVRTAGDQSPWPGRAMVHCKAGLFDGQTGDTRGTLFFDLSPIENRTPSGRLDGPHQLWCHAVHVLGLAGQPNRETLTTLESVPYKAFVAELFRVPNAQTGKTEWKPPRTATERAEYQKAGFEARNFVRSLGRLG